MDGSPDSELRPHEYTIRQGGVESGPFTMIRLREMWATGELDRGTMFRRSDLDYWMDADDLMVELEFIATDEEAAIVEKEAATPASEQEDTAQVAANLKASDDAPATLNSSAHAVLWSQPYRRPILYKVLWYTAVAALVLGAIAASNGGQAILLKRARSVDTWSLLIGLPVFLFGILTATMAFFLDYLGRVAHFTQQSAELLQRELPVLRSALQEQRKD